jgi:hypothetical protein
LTINDGIALIAAVDIIALIVSGRIAYARGAIRGKHCGAGDNALRRQCVGAYAIRLYAWTSMVSRAIDDLH